MNYIFILLSLIIINIPTVFANVPGQESIVQLLNIAVIFGVSLMTGLNFLRFLGKNTQIKTKRKDGDEDYSNRIKLFSFCYVFIFSTAVLRVSFNEVLSTIDLKIWIFIQQLIFFLNIYLIFALSKDRKDYIKINICFICSIPVYVATNVIMVLIGLQKQPEAIQSIYGGVNLEYGVGNSFLLSLLGIDFKKIIFPLADGINSFGVAAGASIVASLIIFRLIIINNQNNNKAIRKLSLLNIASLLSGFSAILISDNRSAFLALLFIISFVYTRINKTLKILLFTVVLTSFLVMPLISTSYDLGFLSRSGSNILSERDVIWGAAIARLASFSPMDLIGFGMYGQVASGLSNSYSFLFSTRSVSNAATLHNFLLQTIFDIGYLGLFVILAIVFTIIKKKITYLNYNYSTSRFKNYTIIEQNSIAINQAKILLLIYFLLIGVTESLPSFYYISISLIFHTFLISELFSSEDENNILFR
jgi:hypothetical protein